MTEIKGCKVPIEETKTWENRPLLVPSLPPTIVGFDMITLEYELQFQLEVPCGINAKIKMPIVIGTIPLASFINGAEYFNTHTPYHSTPPPSYMEAMSYQSLEGNEKIQKHSSK